MIISTYEDLLELMPTQMWKDLRDLTRSNLSIVEPENSRIVKFVYVHDVHSLSVVVSEKHIKVDIELASYNKVTSEIRKAFGIAGALPIDIRFVGQPLREGDSLANIGAFYQDKVYLGFDLPHATGPGAVRLREYDDYIMSAASYLREKPDTYLNICEDIVRTIKQDNHKEADAENLWRRLVLLRNTPALIVNTGTPKLILDCISELISTLNDFKANGNIQYIYNIINALEWLAYLSPIVFEVLGRGNLVLKSFVENIAQIITAESHPLLLRMEAVWALGWAGVASPDVGPEALPILITLETQVDVPILRQIIRAAGLRVGYFRSAYSWASVSKEAGSFIPIIRDTSPTIGALVGSESTKLFTKALELAVRERDLIQDLPQKTEETIKNTCELAIDLRPRQPIGISLRGLVRFESQTQDSARIDTLDISNFERRTRDILQLKEWRFQSRDIGNNLYRLIFLEHSQLMSCYHRALGRVNQESNLHIEFKSSLDLIRLPIEFLSDDLEFLALKHPISRLFTGVYTSRSSFSLNELLKYKSGKNRLRILLVASDTGGIPGVESEIYSLDRVLRDLLASQGIAFEITSIFTNQASVERIRKELGQGSYQIFHYAGHGSYNEKSENSSLYFWEGENRSGKPIPMTANELGILLRETDLQFVYLSCCSSTEHSNKTVNLDDDFMGITDALIKAGVPSVLGFRWPVSDRGALNLATEFYKSFAVQGELDLALLDARRKVAEFDRSDSAWLSPVLVVQQKK
jgi:hypothetical protein